MVAPKEPRSGHSGSAELGLNVMFGLKNKKQMVMMQKGFEDLVEELCLDGESGMVVKLLSWFPFA